MSPYDSILITGGGGMLGQALRDVLIARGHMPVALTHAELEISDANAVASAFSQYKPKLVLNCAAHTKVDLCELEEVNAQAINGRAVGTLAQLCRKHDAVLAHVSTDFVFDGTLRRPYRVNDAANPLSAYGRSKLLGERELQEHAPPRWLIVRTAWVYGRHGANFPRTMVQAARAGKPLRVVDDQVGSPTYAMDLAQGILDLLDSNAAGIWHLTNAGQTSWFDFAKSTLKAFGIDAPIAPVSSAEWAQIRPDSARRPSYSVLDIEPFSRQVGRPMRDWHEALSDFAAAVRRDGF
jgi:dTDP-4-dehydrorhamnose reductase